MRDRWRRANVAAMRRAMPRLVTAPAPEARCIGWQEVRTFLDPGTQVTGKLSFNTPTRIEGRLRGEVRASELLVVARGGVLQGTVWPRTISIAGEVRGQILGAERIEIEPGGLVVGLIETRALVIAEGARFEGDCRVNCGDTAAQDEPARL